MKIQIVKGGDEVRAVSQDISEASESQLFEISTQEIVGHVDTIIGNADYYSEPNQFREMVIDFIDTMQLNINMQSLEKVRGVDIISRPRNYSTSREIIHCEKCGKEIIKTDD